MTENPTGKPLNYADAGVDVATGEAVVRNMKDLMRSTWGTSIVPDISGFQGVFDDGNSYTIGATDGVGTKLLVAILAKRLRTVGQDLVAMCVNDLVRVGARPLFFLDYLATGKLFEDQHYQILEGIVEGCRIGGFPLIGGETAELPGMYQEGHFDLAGFAIGRVLKSEIVDGKKIKEGARLLGIESSGLHSNGYSLARRVFAEYLTEERVHEIIPSLEKTAAEILLKPTIIYVKPVLDILAQFPDQVQGAAHITGGGIPNKLPKALPEGLGALVEEGSWFIHPVFDYIARNGTVYLDEMRGTFNRGIGMILVVNNAGAIPGIQRVLSERHNLSSYDIGSVVRGSGVNYKMCGV